MNDVHAVVLPVRDDWYAVPIDVVREVVSAPDLTCLVTAPSLVLGLMNLRGMIVPVIDTAQLLAVGVIGHIMFAVVVSTDHGPVAFAATGMPGRGVLSVPAGPSELPGTGGLYRLKDGTLAVLIDPTVCLSPQRLTGAEVHPSAHLFIGS